MIALALLDRILDALRRQRAPRALQAPAEPAAADEQTARADGEPPRRLNLSTINDIEELEGCRAQVLAALRQLEAGAEALATRQRDSRGQSVRSPRARLDDWRALPPRALEFRVFPGTLTPATTGRVLLEQGWIEPSAMELATPAARFYVISAAGRRALKRAERWWERLTPWQRALVWILE